MMVFCCAVFAVLLFIAALLCWTGKLPLKIKTALHMDPERNDLTSKKYRWCLGGLLFPGALVFAGAALSTVFRQGAFLYVGMIWIAAVIVGISLADRFFHKDASS